MAWYRCAACDHDAHYAEFKVDPESDADEPELACPVCDSDRVYEE